MVIPIIDNGGVEMRIKLTRPFDEQRFATLKLEATKLLHQLERYHGAQIHKANTLYHFLVRQVERLETKSESYYEGTAGRLKGYRSYTTLDSLEKYITAAREFLR